MRKFDAKEALPGLYSLTKVEVKDIAGDPYFVTLLQLVSEMRNTSKLMELKIRTANGFEKIVGCSISKLTYHCSIVFSNSTTEQCGFGTKYRTRDGDKTAEEMTTFDKINNSTIKSMFDEGWYTGILIIPETSDNFVTVNNTIIVVK